MKIEYADYVLNSGDADAHTDSNGCQWMVVSMSGWDGAPQRLSTIPYGTKHGSVPVSPMYDSRTVVVGGLLKAPDIDSLWSAYNGLIGTLSLRSPRQFTVYEGTTPKSLWTLSGAPPRMNIRPGHFEFELTLLAPDPLKYGEETTVDIDAEDAATLDNVGNIESSFLSAQFRTSGVLRLRNGTTDRTTRSGKRTIASGAVIDYKKRTVRNGTSDLYWKLGAFSQWWHLAPGENAIMNEGDADLTVTYRPAWA